MITIFNRKEVVTTYDMDTFANARDDLRDAGIEYKIRTKQTGYNTFSTGKGKSASRFLVKGGRYGTEYTIYVKEADYNRAVHIIHNKEGWK